MRLSIFSLTILPLLGVSIHLPLIAMDINCDSPVWRNRSVCAEKESNGKSIQYGNWFPVGFDENGDAVEYLKADDEKQWVEVSTDSSTDIWKQRLMAVNELRAKYKNSTTVVQKEMRDMMKTLRVEDFVDGGIDYTKIYTQEEIDALGS